MNCRFISERPEVTGHRCVCRLCSAQCLAWCRELGAGMSDANDVKWQGWMKWDAVHARTHVYALIDARCICCFLNSICTNLPHAIRFLYRYRSVSFEACFHLDTGLALVVFIRLYHNALQCHFEAQGDRRNRHCKTIIAWKPQVIFWMCQAPCHTHSHTARIRIKRFRDTGYITDRTNLVSC